ncbi:hypothetical protein ACMC5O_000584 [Sphingomonas sediminicola]|uniref:hypothetical protein n=1 Tax=Sphingomonas sediminicola TaxID=386874 RepID=UPI003CFA49A2
MIFHFSISADDPKRTATMFAELWRGQVFYFPMVGKGSWIAHAGDDRRTTIEVYPRDLAFYPNESGEGHQRNEPVSRHGPFHAAVGTPLSIEEVEEIGRRYGCHTILCNRGPFRVIEFWVDNAQMVEMLTPEMQAQYQRSVTPDGFRAMLANVWKLTPEGESLDGAVAA